MELICESSWRVLAEIFQDRYEVERCQPDERKLGAARGARFDKTTASTLHGAADKTGVYTTNGSAR